MTARVGLATLTAQIAPIAAITLFGVTMAMSYPLFGLVLERSGVSGTMIGLNTTAAAVAMVAGAPLLPPVLRRFGLGPLMIAAALVLAATMIAIPLFHNFWYWTALRFLFGIAGTVLFFASEYWIVAAAPELRRGRFIAFYALSVSAGFALGPALLGLTGLDGMLPFAVGAGVVLAGLIPILAGLGTAPAIADDEHPSPFAALRVFVTDPAVVFAVVLFGTIEFGAMALVTVWGVRSGLPEAEAALLLTIFAIGCMVLQLPLGWAADRFDRRLVLAMIAGGSAVAPIGMALSGSSFLLMGFFIALWGALSVGLYTIALTELGARYTGSRLAVGNAAIILGYGIGALVSPALFGWAMDTVAPPDGLMFASAALALLYFGLVAARMARPRSPLTGGGG